MGQFSWFTNDDDMQIVDGKEDRIYMVDDKGNKYPEDCYEGYGVFGGKDFYVLLAEMNGLSIKDFSDSDDPEDALRQAGIEMAFKGSPEGTNPDLVWPSLTHDGNYYGTCPTPDPNQGWEMDEDDYENEDEWEEYDDEDEWKEYDDEDEWDGD